MFLTKSRGVAALAVIGLMLGARPAGAQTLEQQRQAVEARLDQLPPSPAVRVLQARALLRQQLRAQASAELPPLLTYLQTSTTDSLLALHPTEEWLLLAAVQDYAGLLRAVRLQMTSPRPRQRQRFGPADDGLATATHSYVQAHGAAIRAGVEQAFLQPPDREFLRIYTEALAAPAEPDSATAARFDQAARAYLATYPNTEFAPLLRPLLKPLRRKARFGMGLDFHSGTGVFGGTLPAYFRSTFNLGHGFEFFRERYGLYLRNYFGFARLRQPLEYRGTWSTSRPVTYYLPEVSVGYAVYQSGRLQLVPFGGVSAFLFDQSLSKDDHTAANVRSMKLRQPLTAGLNLDIRMGHTDGRFGTPDDGYWLLKLRAGYRHGSARYDAAIHGSVVYLDLGVGLFGRRTIYRRY